jgi:predicted transposase YdaD
MDHDGMWKDLIGKFFPSLLKRAIPELYEEAELSAEPKFLDKEFLDILNTADPTIHKSAHYADYVLEVPLKDGGAEFVIIHIEIQGRGGRGNLAERMYHYKCLIYAHYRKEPAALAIITEGRRKKERFYSHSCFGTETIYRYNNLVLAELDDSGLLESDSPIDLAFYAAKCALRSKEEFQKYSYLRTLAGLLAERGWEPEEKRELMLFIERILYIADKALAEKYREYRLQLSEEGKFMYIPFYELDAAAEVEKRGIEKGKLEGKLEGELKGKLEIARKLLARGDSPDTVSSISGLPKEKILKLMN